MIITIPTWVLWAFGIVIGAPLVVIILFFAYIGFVFWWAFRNGL